MAFQRLAKESTQEWLRLEAQQALQRLESNRLP
jgi:hypothetical protein